MTRILGGNLRGRGVHTPRSIRPSQAKVRAALFDIWSSEVPGCRFADLFAGSGAIGLEALSRGADQVLFVEANSNVFRFLKRNCVRLATANTYQLVKARLPRWPSKVEEPFCDLVFFDPPYSFEAYGELLELARRWMSSEGKVVIEHSRRTEIETVPGLRSTDHRTYGDAALSFFEVDP